MGHLEQELIMGLEVILLVLLLEVKGLRVILFLLVFTICQLIHWVQSGVEL